MYISLANSPASGFKKWSDAREPDNDAYNPGGALPIAVTEPPRDDREAVQEEPHRPWIVPGVGGSF
jgi:hypothetical protein